jgi:uncharacterized RDD family membrane protein YckC
MSIPRRLGSAAVDGILAGSLPEELARALAEHHVVERVATELLASPDFERSVLAALESERTERLVQDVLASPAFERILVGAIETRLAPLLAQAVSSPEVQAAFAQSSKSLAGEVADGIHRRAARLDAKADRRVRAAPVAYAGIATRLGSLVVDALLVVLIVVVGSALIGLVGSLFGHLRPQWLVGLLLGSGWILVDIAYFTAFWSTAGQTPGMRLLRLRVVDKHGESPGPARSLLRLAGLWLAVVPLFAGYLPVLWDPRRRALQDLIAGTDVLYDESTPAAPLATSSTAAA